MSLINTNPVCLYYMPYSGGKFIANCLALSKYVLGNDFQFALKEVLYTAPVDSNFYKFKLDSVMSSLPKNFLTTKQWNEFGDPPLKIQAYPKFKSKFFCHIAHFPDELEKIINQWPNTRTVRLVNYHKFNEFCYKLKSRMPNHEGHRQGFPFYDQILVDTQFEFDVDTIYRSKDFLWEIKRLYDFLELDDFQKDLVQHFHRAYLDVHGLD